MVLSRYSNPSATTSPINEKEPSGRTLTFQAAALHDKISQAANERYLDHLAAADVSASLREIVGDIRERTRKDGKSYRALNPWNTQDFL